MVFVRPLCPVQNTVLLRTLYTAGEGLIDLDVLDSALVLVMLDGKVDSCDRDGLPGEPADALQTENLVAVIAERLVL